MVIADAHVDSPQFFEIRRGGVDGHEFAVHRLGIDATEIFAVSETFTIFVGVVAPQLSAAFAVDGGHIAVGGDDNDFVVCDDGHDIARAEHVGAFTVVPYPLQFAGLEIEIAQICVPRAEDYFAIVNDRRGLAVVEERVIDPYLFAVFGISAFDALVSALDIRAVGDKAVGDIRTF